MGPTGLDSDLATKIEDAIQRSDITLFRATFQEIFMNPFFTECLKSLGPLGYMISGLSYLQILPVIITPNHPSEQVEKKEVVANPALNLQDHLWSDEEEDEEKYFVRKMYTPLPELPNFVWEEAGIEPGMLTQYATFSIRPVLGHAVQLVAARFGDSGHLAYTRRTSVSHINHTTVVRSSGIPIQEMQIRLFKDFFKDILTFSRNKRGRTSLHPHPRFVQGMFVNLQQIIYDFCVAGSDMQAVDACRNRNYTDYMMSNDHYLHLFKMLFGMAKKMLNLVVPIPRPKIEDMISFLSRSMFVKLSSDGVKHVVKFIFDLNTLADTMSSRDPTPKLIVKKLTPIIKRMESTALNLHDHNFPLLFMGNRHAYTFIWLQELLLQTIMIPTIDNWNETSRLIQIAQQTRHRTLDRSHLTPIPSTDHTQTPGRERSRTPRGGSNKKKGSSKKSKKSKKSGRNKVRANKKSKSRRNKKM